jgi:hypothetical protein
MIRYRGLGLFLVAMTFGALPLFAQESGSLSRPASIARPDTEGPTVVTAGIYIIDIPDLNEFQNTFQAELEFTAGWVDPRLAFQPGAEDPGPRIYLAEDADEELRRIWGPYLGGVNVVGKPTMLKTMLAVEPDGRARNLVRITGRIKTAMDFRRFPFDRQTLELRVRPFSSDITEVRLEPNAERTGFDPAFHMPEWEVLGVRTEVGEVSVPGHPEAFSQLTLLIDVKRKSGFYIWKILVPIITIVIISWVIFWMTDELLGRRASASATAILTLIAYQFVLAGTLPRIPYLTVMDKIILLSFILTAVSMIINVVVKYLEGTRTAKRIDWICRWAFPLVYFSALIILLQVNI